MFALIKTFRMACATIMILLGSLTFAGTASAVTIDFEDGTNNSAIGSFYAGLGVEFSNAEWVSISLAGMSGTYGIRAPGTYQFFSDNAVVAIFSAGTDSVSILAADVGANGVRIDAYDSTVGGNLIDSDEAYGTGAGVGEFFTVSALGPSIKRIEIYQIANNVQGEGIALDDLTFNQSFQAVPTLNGASLGILMVLLLSFGMVAARRYSF